MPRPLNSPRPPRYDAAKSRFDLSSSDPKLGKLIERAGPFKLRVASAQSPFEALVESIIYQQLHGKAAATIHRRMIESFAPVPTLKVSVAKYNSPQTQQATLRKLPCRRLGLRRALPLQP